VGDVRRTRRWRKLRAYVLERDRHTCWRCGGAGANEGGHVIPMEIRPDLALDPDNVRAEHSTRAYALSLGYDCPGNRNTNRSTTTPTQPNRRTW
jgi:5-methylcytosine-specific restriction endonuclease McrA